MTIEKRQYIGVDIGGTTIKVGRYDYQGSTFLETQLSTPKPSLPGAVTTAVCDLIESIDKDHSANYVGIALPGPTDAEFRIARMCINLPGWIDVPLANWLESRLKRKVTLGNDGNCALLGERWKGAAKNFQNVVLLTLGTGVGGGVMLNGKLFTGHNGAASEPGLIGVWPNGPNCNSGNQGSLEQFASIAAIKRISGLEPLELFHQAENGSKYALDCWEEYGHNLGIGLSSLIYLLTPELILLGGGISAAAKYFLPSVHREINIRVNSLSREGLIIRTCELANGAGRLGAALTAIKRF